MIVDLDASAAFDLIDRSFVVQSLKVIGAGPRLIKWTESYHMFRLALLNQKELCQTLV